MPEMYIAWSCGFIFDLVFYKIFNLNIFMFAGKYKKCIFTQLDQDSSWTPISTNVCETWYVYFAQCLCLYYTADAIEIY